MLSGPTRDQSISPRSAPTFAGPRSAVGGRPQSRAAPPSGRPPAGVRAAAHCLPLPRPSSDCPQLSSQDHPLHCGPRTRLLGSRLLTLRLAEEKRSVPGRSGAAPPPWAPISPSPPPSAPCLRALLLKPRAALSGLSPLWPECLSPACPLCFLLQCLGSSLSGYHFHALLSHPKFTTHTCTPRWCCTHHPSRLPCFIPLHCIRQHLTYDSLFFYLRRCLITTPYTLNLPRTWVSQLLLKRPKREYFWLCGPCAFLSQLLHSAIIEERSHWQYHVPVKLYLQKQVASPRFGPWLTICHPCSRIITSIIRGLHLIYLLFYPYNFEGVWYKVVPQ